MSVRAPDRVTSQIVAVTLSPFVGQGEMCRRCRAFDWSATPLGPVSMWSQSLRALVAMMLGSRHPMFLWWGPDLIQIYNDGYLPSFGTTGRDVAALGARGREHWAEIWPIIGPEVEAILDGGEATWHENHLVPIERNGRVEDVWWTYGYSPVRDDDGSIGGVLVVVQETTANVLALAEAERLRTDAERAGERLGELFRQAPAFIAVIRGRDFIFELANDAYYQLIGRRDIIGKPVFEAIPDARGQGFEELLQSVMDTGVPAIGQEVPIEIARTPGLPAEQRYISFVYAALTEADGSRSGVFVHGVDVTEQVHARKAVESLNEQLQRNASALEQRTSEAMRAAQSLEETEARLKLALDASQLGTWDLDLVTMVVSRSALHDRAFGHEALLPEWSYPLFLEHVHPDDRAEVDRRFRETQRTGVPLNFECRVVWPDTTVHWIAVCSDVHRNTLGVPGRLIGSVQDITDRKQKERQVAESEMRLRTIVDTIPQLAWMTEPDGSIIWYNQRWYDYTATTPREMAGWGWQTVHDARELPRVLERWRAAIEEGVPWEDTFPLRRHDGIFRSFLSRAFPIRNSDGEIVHWFGTNTDITTLEETRRAAERSNTAKSEFLAMMSHELRTPLNAIGGYAELLAMGVRGPVNAEQVSDLERIQRAQRHLLGLVNGVLNYAKVDAGAMTYQIADVPMDEVLATCEALVAPMIRAKELSFRVADRDPQLLARADYEKVQQIVLNLLSNAIKFTEANGSITLACAVAQGRIVVRVGDTGRGIAADQLERVFQPFVQVDARLTRTQEGTGLGLAISRDLARGMGGDLTVESAPKLGSTFSLILLPP
ncbi:MAG: PAS domain-containing protein [bacterium]